MKQKDAKRIVKSVSAKLLPKGKSADIAGAGVKKETTEEACSCCDCGSCGCGNHSQELL